VKIQRSRLSEGDISEHCQRTRTHPVVGSRFSSELPASVAPFVRGVPKRLFVATQKGRCALAPQRMLDHERTLPEGVLVDSHVLNSSVNSKRNTLLAEQGLGDRQKFFVLDDFT
jgi:hypothetical protein